jgi:uncharacterized protein YvpB
MTTKTSENVVILDVPHRNQRNNEGNEVVYGDQMCNVTALAACAMYYGATPDEPFTQLEDQISAHFNSNGLSHFEPYAMETGYNSLFSKSEDTFYPEYDITQITERLREGKPCVVHGYFTESGHIVTAVGFDANKKELCINDPYGKWTPYGYTRHSTQTEQSLEGYRVWLPYSVIDELCYDNGIWTHVISPNN